MDGWDDLIRINGLGLADSCVRACVAECVVKRREICIDEKKEKKSL